MRFTIKGGVLDTPGDSAVYRLLRFFCRFDLMQIIPVAALLSVGVFYIYSTGQQIGGNPEIWKKQLIFICFGIVLWFFLSVVDYRVWRQFSPIFYLASLVLLTLVLFIGEVRFGARRWFSVFGFLSIQPSEFAKIAMILTIAWIMSLRAFTISRAGHVAGILLITALPFGLIAVQPDLGSAMILWPMVAAMLFVAGLKWKWICVAAAIAALLAPTAYFLVLREYQKERILVFLDPARDPDNKGWNSRQSQLAVGSGGLWGKGPMQSTQSTLGFLPKTVANSDFIFSVIAEETGFVGSSAVILLYVLLVFSGMRLLLFINDPFGRSLAAGFSTLFFIHSAVNIGMTIRLMPVTGLPLPLVSLGGSFIISSMACLGLLQSIHIHRQDGIHD